MSNIYIARQPIFNQNMTIYGYEMLHRKSVKNSYEGTDHDKATASLLDDFFITEFPDLVGDKKGFVNFTSKLLIKKAPFLLPKSQTIIEISSNVETDQEFIDVCKEMKKEGYVIALDNFALNENQIYNEKIIALADIVKIDFVHSTIKLQEDFLRKYKGKIIFLAEKIEIREDFKLAKNMGYNLFQGYFFSKPVMINAQSIGNISDNLVKISQELRKTKVNLKYISSIFERDLDLSYKLLKMVNSAFYGSSHSIESIHQAVVRLGVLELYRWVNIMMMKDIENTQNTELIQNCLIRGKFLSLFAATTKSTISESDFFMCGMFSSLDVLLNKSMEEVLEKLPLDDIVKDTLLGKETEIYDVLNMALALEQAKWNQVDKFVEKYAINKGVLMKLYTQAIKWQCSLN